jgi:hypothetical protein
MCSNHSSLVVGSRSGEGRGGGLLVAASPKSRTARKGVTP